MRSQTHLPVTFLVNCLALSSIIGTVTLYFNVLPSNIWTFQEQFDLQIHEILKISNVTFVELQKYFLAEISVTLLYNPQTKLRSGKFRKCPPISNSWFCCENSKPILSTMYQTELEQFKGGGHVKLIGCYRQNIQVLKSERYIVHKTNKIRRVDKPAVKTDKN